MRTIILVLVLAQSWLAHADAVSDACLACHKDALSLQGREVNAVAALIKDMRDERVPHPAPIPKLTDAAVETLAAAVTAR